MQDSANRYAIGPALVSFVATALAVVAAWWWLGAPIALPPFPAASAAKLYCVSYAPFRGAQNPLVEGTRVPSWQIDQDLALIAKYSNCVRTYSVDDAGDEVLKSARRYGLKVLHGIWIGRDVRRNRRQIAATITYAREYSDIIAAIVVGNEVLLRGEMSAADLTTIIRQVKAQVSEPVTYADVWEFWLRHPDVENAVDFVTVHILPYWEDFPIPAQFAAAHVAEIRARVAAAFPGKDIVIGEFGWPSAGRMREAARPSPVNQALAIRQTVALARRENFRLNVIEAFDQPWKRALEGVAGGYWGIFDRATDGLKFSMTGPVSNHPHWLMQALAGVLLAVLTFAGALAGGREKGFTAASWARIAALAFLPAVLFGWIVETVPVESFNLGSTLRSWAFAAVAAFAPIVCAAACAAARPIPAFASLLGGRGAPRTRLDWALGGTLIALMLVAVEAALGLVFDPRYRDIPFAPLIAALAAYLFVTLTTPRPAGPRATAEALGAAVLVLSAAYIVFNESFANWQSVSFCAGAIGLAVILARSRRAPSSE